MTKEQIWCQMCVRRWLDPFQSEPPFGHLSDLPERVTTSQHQLLQPSSQTLYPLQAGVACVKDRRSVFVGLWPACPVWEQGYALQLANGQSVCSVAGSVGALGRLGTKQKWRPSNNRCCVRVIRCQVRVRIHRFPFLGLITRVEALSS